VLKATLNQLINGYLDKLNVLMVCVVASSPMRAVRSSLVEITPPLNLFQARAVLNHLWLFYPNPKIEIKKTHKPQLV
jgi:hypothetical protein